MIQQRTREYEREPTTWRSARPNPTEDTAELQDARLTWEEMDALAHEIGVAPVELREAVVARSSRRRTRHASTRLPTRRTARRERFLMGGIPLLYGLSITTPLSLSDRSDTSLAVLCFILPQIVSLHLGILLGSKHQAAIAGVLVNACTVAAAIVSARVRNGHVSGSAEDWKISFALLIAGMLAAVIGAAVRQLAVARKSAEAY